MPGLYRTISSSGILGLRNYDFPNLFISEWLRLTRWSDIGLVFRGLMINPLKHFRSFFYLSIVDPSSY